MDVCSSGHDEIVHNERKCPLCEAKQDLMAEIEGARIRESMMDRRIDELLTEIERLNEPFRSSCRAALEAE